MITAEQARKYLGKPGEWESPFTLRESCDTIIALWASVEELERWKARRWRPRRIHQLKRELYLAHRRIAVLEEDLAGTLAALRNLEHAIGDEMKQNKQLFGEGYEQGWDDRGKVRSGHLSDVTAANPYAKET